jgi:hypothetical protein
MKKKELIPEKYNYPEKNKKKADTNPITNQ